jgi:23S rRNA (uracil1939-C5)-methyltransferase
MSTKVIKPVHTGDVIEIEISSLAFGGESVGRYQDFAIFVPGGLPGERVTIKITQVKDHYAIGEITDLLKRSADRVAPPCPIFEECGGCQWQHIQYPRQLQTKRQFVVDAFQRIGHLPDLTVQPCLPSPVPYGYRNKAMPVLSMREGHFISGIYEPRSHHLIPYQSCPIQGDPINDLIQKVLQKIDRSGLTPYQEKKHTGFLRHLAVRHGVKTGELILSFVTRTEVPEERVQKPTQTHEPLNEILPRLAQELMQEIPGLVGVVQNINPSRTNIVFGSTTRLLAGRDHYFEILDSLKLKVSLKSFLQVNTLQADILHAVVREALGEPEGKKKWETLLDLYSGIGTLAMAVSDQADYVVGIEEVGAAVEDAKVNIGLNNKENIDFLEGDVSQVLIGLKEKGLTRVDGVILDPPRKGVLPEVLARVTAFHPERLVYVSCDPSTLARDLSLLTKHGYMVDWAQPLDMFPQTYHVETVVKLTRTAPMPQDLLLGTGEKKPEPFRLPKPPVPLSLNISSKLMAFREGASRVFGTIVENGKKLIFQAKDRLGPMVKKTVMGSKTIGSSAVRGIGSSLGFLVRKAAVAGKWAGNRTLGVVKIIRGFKLPARRKTDPIEPPIQPQREVEPIEPIASSVLDEYFETKIAMDVMEEEERERPRLFVGIEPSEEEKNSKENIELDQTLPKSEILKTEILNEIKQKAPVEPLEVKQKQVEKSETTLPLPLAETQKTEEISEEKHTSFVEPVLPMALPPPVTAETILRSSLPIELEAPAPRISKKWIMPVLFNSNKFRWALIVVFLLGGGAYWAKATLSSSSANTTMLIPTVSQMIPDVIAVMPTRNFLRYEMVPFEVRVNPHDESSFSDMHAMVEVYRDGEPVSMVDGRVKLYLKKDMAGKRLLGNWPIPYNPKPGTYIAEVIISSSGWKSPKTFESAFTIPPLKPQGLYPGYAALTMEGGKQLVNGGVPALDGSNSSNTANAIQWAKFMGANIFCDLMGQTSIWDHLQSRDFPYNQMDLEAGRRYAQEAHDAGMKFASYMTTFKVMGDGWQQAPYEFSMGYDPDTDEVIQTRFISLEDKKRRSDIIDFLKMMDKDPLVDMVGLDYVRTGFAGYEMVDQFVKDLNVPGPTDFWSMSKQDRIHWLARTVELKENKQVVSLFEWWRAHRVALALKSILDEAKMSKPVFTFTLGWQMGHQHGQDPAMFIDAGVNFNQIMLYEGTREHIDAMKQQWPEYLARDNGMYAMGEMVDFNWVQKNLNPPGPQELYNREIETFRNWFPVNANLGMFWHDLYRIVWGIRGPYSSMEWAISGGKAFSVLQQAEGLSPVDVNLWAPTEAPVGVPVPLNVEIRNHSPEDLKGVMLHQLDTSKNFFHELATVGPFDVPAGNMVRVKSLFINMPREPHPERDNRYMAAVMLEKPGDSMRAFDFAYIKGLPPGAAMKKTDTAPEQETPTSDQNDSFSNSN